MIYRIVNVVKMMPTTHLIFLLRDVILDRPLQALFPHILLHLANAYMAQHILYVELQLYQQIPAFVGPQNY